MIYLAHNHKMLKADSTRPGRYFGWIDNWREPEYTITVGSTSHGSVTASAVTATEGTTIILTASPDSDYALSYFTVNGVAIVGNYFTMPAEDVTVSAIFVATFDEITIGNQTWMAKNLTIDDDEGGISTQTVNYGQGDVVEYYYTWYAAKRVAESVGGWHIPTSREWYELANAVGGSDVAGTKLKSTYGWSSGNGDGSTNFAALPAGRCYMGTFDFLQSRAYFWTATEYSSTSSTWISFTTGSSMGSYSNYKYAYQLSVRLVKD